MRFKKNIKIYQIYPKYLDILTPYRTCPKLWVKYIDVYKNC